MEEEPPKLGTKPSNKPGLQRSKAQKIGGINHIKHRNLGLLKMHNPQILQINHKNITKCLKKVYNSPSGDDASPQ